jgi:very-short-patch-repair endonuclease
MPDERESTPVQQELVNAHPDRAVAALAARQHGVVARRQLEALGLTPSMLEWRLAAGRLIRVHRGVYAVGHRVLRTEGHWLAAVLAAGPGAVLSHREAAALHSLRPSNRPSVDVTVAAQRRVPGVQVHRVAALDVEDLTVVEGIPVTSIERTLVDLAGVVPPTALRKATEEAVRSHRFDLRAIERVLARTRGRHGRGTAAMRAALAELRANAATVTYSDLEDRFLALLDAHVLSRPLTNALVGGIQVDALWPRERVVVELDGWAYHHTAPAFQRDRERSNDLQLDGYVVLRFTHDHVVRHSREVAARIARALRR